MAECGICGKDKPAKRNHKVYTAIQQQSTAKTAYKQFETKTQYLFFNDQTYPVCADCIRRYRIYTWVIWLPACLITPFIVWMLLPEGQDSSACFLALMAPLLPLALAFWIWTAFFEIKGKLVKKAVAARDATDWRNDVSWMPDLHQGYGNADKSLGIAGFTEAAYIRLQKKS